MKQIKVAKRIPFFVNIKANGKEQIFEFSTTNKKYLAYAYDARFVLKRKIDKLIMDNLQPFTVLRRDEEKDKIIIVYDTEINFPARIVNCEFYLPPYNGCLYCLNAKKDGEYLYCSEKEKHYSLSGIKSCPIFKSIEEIV